MSAIMKIDQTGTPAGVAGFARDDGLADGTPVVLTSVAHERTFRFRILWPGLTPSPDTTSIPTLQQSGPASYTFTPTAGVYGTWSIELITDEGTANEDHSVKGWGVKQGPSAIRIPAPNEKGVPDATALNYSAQQVARCDFNQPEGSGIWQDGRTVSWWRELAQLIFAVNAGGGGGGGLVFTAIQDADYTATFGQHVLLGDNDPSPAALLPLAADQANGQVGVTAVTGSAHQITPAEGDTISGDTSINEGQTLILQSDGAVTWYVVASVGF